ncbi:L-2-hydroxyglutarate oxidase LhgO [Hathewaya proteolytica DSM 3090]|uniref:L-2-hydroxyglutarate oxidase LhgO n=1 Tax=Hathewaya proteolytica DSM 3090 TaxID=1121331 RepID=A0A1M6T741_9CLOT|nr:FAD-dependent oxidoreductase [Hathewaya proteolytica]SHK52795.1 L-2-hydroxyglutarate oxidase LhgO [Hathewaya proteolytica DSM 3090]
MDYDVLILGGELIGCAIAYELSKYNLNIALIEKNYDIADEVNLGNTSMIFNGVENKDENTAQLEYEGNKEIEQVAKKFSVPYRRMPSIIMCDEENYIVDSYKNLEDKYRDSCRLIGNSELNKIEPGIDCKNSKWALYINNTGIISPYDLAISYGEVAFDNNVNFKLEEEVIDITRENKGFRVSTNKNRFTCKIVINTTRRHNYSIDTSYNTKKKDTDTRIKFFTTQKDIQYMYSNLIFSIKNGRYMVALPNLDDGVVGALITKDELDNSMVFHELKDILPGVPNSYIKSFYESNHYDEPYHIIKENDYGYIQVSDKHYAIATMAPAIAKKVVEYVAESIHCSAKKDFLDKRRDFYRFRDMDDKQRNEIINVNPKYGKVICHCNMITEGEIEDAIRRPLGARTLEGVKRRTGAAFGKCEGSRCLNKILRILARETNKPLTSIVKDSKNSNVLLNRIKEFDSM